MPLTSVHVLGQRFKRPTALGVLTALVLAVALTLALFAIHATSSYAATGGAASEGGATYQPTPATQPGLRATISTDGRTAVAPLDAPLPVQKAIWAANKITKKPYIYGGGHATFKKISKGYDCSSTISYAIGNADAGFLETPLNSSGFMRWGLPGKGAWITVYAHPGHAYAIIAGLRLDTSGPGERGPRWRAAKRSAKGFRVRHPEGY